MPKGKPDATSARSAKVPVARPRPIPANEWVWCGYPGHFIAAESCRMHLHTRVGDYRISTVGDYHPLDVLNPDPKLHLRPTKKAEPIGAGEDSLYETFVFPVTGEGQHGEGEVTTWSEIDGTRYAEAEDAERGHMNFCRQYARIARADRQKRTTA